MENCQWVYPTLVAQVEFTEWRPEGHYDMPVARGCEMIKRQPLLYEHIGVWSDPITFGFSVLA